MRLTRWLTLRLFGVTALLAVGSFWWQVMGLSGSRGIVPIAEQLEALRRAGVGFFRAPTLLWLSASDGAIHAACALAFSAALAVTVGLAPRLSLGVLWVAWLSLCSVASPWLGFQWDVLLLEGAFTLAFFAPPGWRPRLSTEPEPSPAFTFLAAWLACRMTLASGVVKLASGDPSWRDLTALTWHWWTQPLPTWTSIVAAAFPLWAQKLMCLSTLVLELPVPLLALGGRATRRWAALGLMTLQAGLFAGGNYSYYNLLAFVLAVPLLDDALLRQGWPKKLGWPAMPELPPRRARPWEVAWVALIVLLGVGVFFRRAARETPLSPVLDAIGPFETINGYGAFAVMTKTRPEIILEGSADGVTWRPYEFPWKPGDVRRRPKWVAPLQPRLDWQMWFASLGDCSDSPWLLMLQRRLLQGGSQEVQALFEVDPFASAPPRFLRTVVYEYRFASLAQPGAWWTRRFTGPFCPALTLSPTGELVKADVAPP